MERRGLLGIGRRGSLCLFAALTCMAASSTPALASSANVSATQAYVQANYTALHTAIGHLATSEAGPLHVLAQVQRQCPLAGAQSPEDPESTQMSNEVIGDMVISAIAPDLQAIRQYIHTVAPLRWSSSSLTHAIRAYTNDWKTLVSLSAPNLCGDVKAWATSGYHALPASTVTFVSTFFPNWVGAGYMPAQLSRYENSATKALASRCNKFEQEIAEAEARAVAHWGAIMDTLELWP